MKGKQIFTTAEARKIRQLIQEKLVADIPNQKRIRDEIRALGFYISDFSNKKNIR
ncbi:MAG TPA: hypothetical protein VNS58_09190 [Puia sp.]|nr:hypothetical protein [Puia sp.]